MAEIPKSPFYIISNMTGHVLSISGQSQTSGAKLVIEPKNTQDPNYQKWTYDATKKTFQSQLTPYFVITLQGGTFATGAPIINETYTAGQTYQQWKAPFDSTIQSANEKGYVIGLKGGSGSSGTEAVLTTRTSQPEPHAMWRFEAA